MVTFTEEMLNGRLRFFCSKRRYVQICYAVFSETGNYLYTEATGAKEGDTATLTTRTIQAGTGKHCLQFFYYDYGEDMGSLDVKVQGEPQNLFSVSGGQEPGWREINKNIGKTSPFKVRQNNIFKTFPRTTKNSQE